MYVDAKGKTIIRKDDIAEEISLECGLTKKKAKDVVETVFEYIKASVAADSRVTIRNFGRFEKHEVSNRGFKNCENATVNRMHFKPSTTVRGLLNECYDCVGEGNE